ncbi:MAG: hypothetical protein P8105_09385 [Dehalococcoidia bacterium]
MIILSTIAGIVLLGAGSVGMVLTWINYQIATLNWIEGILTYGVFVVLGLVIIGFILMTPRES